LHCFHGRDEAAATLAERKGREPWLHLEIYLQVKGHLNERVDSAHAVAQIRQEGGFAFSTSHLAGNCNLRDAQLTSSFLDLLVVVTRLGVNVLCCRVASDLDLV
jgi:hypothetical protein